MTDIIKDIKILSQVSEPINFEAPQRDVIDLAGEMVKVMVDAGGIGLSAIQIGVPLRMICIRSFPQNQILVNPKIVHASEEAQSEIEGCLSFPNLVMKIKRPFQVRVRYQLVDGTFKTDTWGGMTARVVCHEIDHLNGVLFYTKANRIHRERAFRQRDRIVRGIKSLENV
jgi:peptide deformylase